MSASQKKYFSGDTLRQALVQAANHFHLNPEEIAYQPIEKRHGFIKARRKFLIEVNSEAPRWTGPAPPIPAPPARPASPAPPMPTISPMSPMSPMPPISPISPAPSAPQAVPPAPQAISPAPQVAPREVVPPPAPPAPRQEAPPRPVAARSERPERPERRPRPTHPPSQSAEPRPSPPRSEPPRPRPDDQEGLVTLPERPRSASERFPAAIGPHADAAKQGLTLLLSIAGLDLSPTILQGEGRLEIELSGSDTDRCFEEEGEVLRSIEHLLPRLIRTLSGDAVPCRVDCDNFHEIREEQLRTLAQRVAAEVCKRGRYRTLEPMNPADRRVIHMTLADDPGVVTESEGEGYFKRVTIRPA